MMLPTRRRCDGDDVSKFQTYGYVLYRLACEPIQSAALDPLGIVCNPAC
jgi:hypothetical protein